MLWKLAGFVFWDLWVNDCSTRYPRKNEETRCKANKSSIKVHKHSPCEIHMYELKRYKRKPVQSQHRRLWLSWPGLIKAVRVDHLMNVSLLYKPSHMNEDIVKVPSRGFLVRSELSVNKKHYLKMFWIESYRL